MSYNRIPNLNPPPHPFWDFVANIEDHPFFGAYGRGNQANDQNNGQPGPSSRPEPNRQPTAEDPPEVDPSTVRPDVHPTNDIPFRGRGRFGGAFPEGRPAGPGCRGRGPPGHRGGLPPFGPFGPHMFPPWARGHHGGPHHGPGRRGRHGPGGPNFDLGQFLNNLGERLGIDLAGAAENLGINQFTAARNNSDADFEPRTDIFETNVEYIAHLSLPGAKKEDVGVDWDGENSILRIAGVVHRPGADEQLLSQLVLDGRKRETGVFEKAIRLGTKEEPANIDVAGITAKMTDGVLVVRVPKVEVEHKKREVPITNSASQSPQRAEKDLLFDADEEMYDAPTKQAPAEPEARKDLEKAMAEHTKADDKQARDDRSVTADHEEQLPRYEGSGNDESDWEKAGSDDETDYVKISVD
jgi:HSP20 family protein